MPRTLTNTKGRRRRPGSRPLGSAMKTADSLFEDFVEKMSHVSTGQYVKAIRILGYCVQPGMRSRSRSRSRRNGLLGDRAGAGAVKNGAAPAPKRDTMVDKLRNVNSEITNSRTNSLPIFFINNFRTSAMNYLKFYLLAVKCIFMI